MVEYSIRVDYASKQASVIDVICNITDLSSNEAKKSQFVNGCRQIRINGKGCMTPVADAKTMIRIIWDLPGSKSRVDCANYICRILGGDPTLIKEMENVRKQEIEKLQADAEMRAIEDLFCS
jgi:hypothetical protein